MTTDVGRSGAGAPSGLRPDGLSQSSLSQAEPLVPNAVRTEVAAFALLMERELAANDHKPGWKNDGLGPLTDRLLEEAGELEKAAIQLLRQVIWADERGYGTRGGNGWSRLDPKTRKRQVGVGYHEMAGQEREQQLAKIISEAADVANFAMMIADVCGALRDGDGCTA